MSIALDIYQAFKDDEAKARALAEAFDRLERRVPSNVATEDHLEATKLALQKEIEHVRADLTERIEQLRADLTERIEQLRADLTKRIEQNRLEIERVRADLTERIEEVRWSTIRWVAGLLIAQAGVIVTLIKLLP